LFEICESTDIYSIFHSAPSSIRPQSRPGTPSKSLNSALVERIGRQSSTMMNIQKHWTKPAYKIWDLATASAFTSQLAKAKQFSQSVFSWGSLQTLQQLEASSFWIPRHLPWPSSWSVWGNSRWHPAFYPAQSQTKDGPLELFPGNLQKLLRQCRYGKLWWFSLFNLLLSFLPLWPTSYSKMPLDRSKPQKCHCSVSHAISFATLLSLHR
jgi:hypothetical protein